MGKGKDYRGPSCEITLGTRQMSLDMILGMSGPTEGPWIPAQQHQRMVL